MVVQDLDTCDVFYGQVPRGQCIIPVQHLEPFNIEMADSSAKITDLTVVRNGNAWHFLQGIFQRSVPLADQSRKIEAERIPDSRHDRSTDNSFLQLHSLLL